MKKENSKQLEAWYLRRTLIGWNTEDSQSEPASQITQDAGLGVRGWLQLVVCTHAFKPRQLAAVSKI